MMKSTIRTLFLLSALLFSACEKDDSIFTELSIRFVMPDSRPVEKLEIRTDISYFDNINSGERVPFPAAEQNSATPLFHKHYRLFFRYNFRMRAAMSPVRSSAYDKKGTAQ